MDFTKFDDNGDDNSSESGKAIDEEMVSDQEGGADVGSDLDENQDIDESSEEDDDDDNVIIAEINRLQEELSINSLDYEKYVTLITKLRIIGELDILRETHEKMNKIYPLSPKIWLDWIEDEKKVACTDEQRTAIIGLYNRAVAEYLDSDIWSSLIQYSIELSESNLIKTDAIREIFDRALSHLGCSVLDGALIWQRYRLFEEYQLNNFDSVTEDNLEQINKQVKIIYDLYNRQFSLPLLKMEIDYQQFEHWLEKIKENYGIDLMQNKSDIKNIKSEYKKSLNTLELLRKYEDNLENSDSPHFEEYIKYIDFELKNDNLARTQCLFERALTENCLQPDLWIKYLRYCDSKFVVGDLLLPIYERAIRNCPWIAKIWIQYMLACERLGQSDYSDSLKEKILKILEQALLSTEVADYKEIWMVYLNFLRRCTCKTAGWNDEEQVKNIRETFEGAIISIEQITSFELCYDLYRYFAKIEAKYCKNIENARNIWKKLIDQSSTLRRQASFWLDYANMEMLYGQEVEYRKVLLKGLNMCSDYPESIGDALLRFEMEDSDSIEQYQLSLFKYENALKKINEKRSKEAEKEKNSVEVKTQPAKSLKRKIESDISNLPKNGNSEAKKKKVTEQVHGISVKTDESKREQTVFLSNLNFDLTEDEIREAFLQFGPISEVRLVRNFKGLSKGFCYVEFESFESSRKALLHDRMLLRGRPVYISEMDKRTKFSYSTNQEKNKIFVKNIPFDVTKEDLLAKVFSDYADSIVNIRLVTHRDGRSRGLAYVEMKNSTIAEKVAKEKNDFLIGDRKLFVAISDPSLANKNANSSLSNPTQQSFKPSSLMIPHSLMAKSHPSKVKIQLNQETPTVDAKADSTNGSTNESTQLSNDKFRSMFLK